MTRRREIWDSLSPNAKRGLAVAGIGIAALGLFGAIASLVPEAPKPTDKQAVVKHILTDSDPRSLGIDGLATQLKQVAQKHEDLLRRLESIEEQQKRASLSDEERFRKLGEDQASSYQSHIDALKSEIETLKRDKAGAPSKEPTVPSESSASQMVLPPVPHERLPRPSKTGPTPQDLDHLFEQPTPTPLYGGSPGNGSATGQNAANVNKGRLEIRVIKPEAEKAGHYDQDAQGPDGRSPSRSEIFIPAGSLLSGYLLNGLDAPTGKGARKEPFPVLTRLKDEAILPNRYRADVRECFLIAAGYGDLSAERAYLRGETISCVRDDGGVIEVPIDAYAVGEDGKLGLRGRVVSKQGQLLANALLAGFARGFSDAFGRNQVPVILTGGAAALGQTTPFQRAFSDQAMEGGALKGAGYAMDRLAHYYMDLAENLFPIIEVDATRKIEFIVQRGTALKLASGKDPQNRNLARLPLP
jgi:conjugal transfer pilus assembly protein TraB